MQKIDAKREERERLARIAEASPPASTFDGQVQRLRDRRAEARGEPAPGTVLDEDDMPEVDSMEPDEDAQAAETVLAATPRRGRRPGWKPGHRVDERGASSSELPWWTRTAREGFTQTAEAERARMEKTKVAASVVGRINE